MRVESDKETRTAHDVHQSYRVVRDILAAGTHRALKTAQVTMASVREALDVGYLEKFRGRQVRLTKPRRELARKQYGWAEDRGRDEKR